MPVMCNMYKIVLKALCQLNWRHSVCKYWPCKSRVLMYLFLICKYLQRRTFLQMLGDNTPFTAHVFGPFASLVQNLLENWDGTHHLLDVSWQYGPKNIFFRNKTFLFIGWVEILWGFTNSNFELNLKVSAFYLEKQKCFIPKKNIF